MMRAIVTSMLSVSVFLFITLAYPQDTPEIITLDSLSNRYGPVEFSHGEHADMVGDCASCHHHSEGGTTPSCQECHEPLSIYHYEGALRQTGLGLKGAYHRQCMGCHKEMESGPVGCTDCHDREVKE